MTEVKDSVLVELDLDTTPSFDRASERAKAELRGVSRSADAAKKAFGGIAAVAGGVAAGVVAVAGALGGVAAAANKAAESFARLAQRGGGFDAVASRFESMADPGLIQRLQELSGWQIRQTDIMRSYTQTMEVGLVSAGEYEDWLTRITRLAQDRGGDPTQWLQRFTQVISGGGIETLREMGVNTMQVMDRLRELGVSMRSEEGRVIGLRIAMEQLAETQGEVSNSASHLGDVVSQLDTMWEDFLDSQARQLSTIPELVHGFSQIQTELLGTEGATVEAGRGFRDLAVTAAQAVASVARELFLGLADINQGMEQAARAMLRNETIRSLLDAAGLADDVRRAASGFEAMASMANQAAEAAGRVRSAFGDDTEIDDGETTPGRRGPRATRSAAGGGGGQERVTLGQQMLDIMAQEIERRRELIVLENENASVEKAWREQQAQEERELHEERMAQVIELATARDKAEQKAAEYREREREAILQRREEVLSVVDAAASFGQTTSSIIGQIGTMAAERHKAHIAQMKAQGASTAEIAKAEKKAEKSAEAVAKAQGVFLVAYNSVMAATEVARAIGSYPDVAGIIAHSAAAAAHVAAAVMAGVQLKGGSTSASASVDAGSFTPAEQEVPAAETAGSGGTTIINEYSLSRTNDDLARAMVEADWRSQQTGSTPYRPANMMYEAA